jgi:hypothetical protein
MYTYRIRISNSGMSRERINSYCYRLRALRHNLPLACQPRVLKIEAVFHPAVHADRDAFIAAVVDASPTERGGLPGAHSISLACGDQNNVAIDYGNYVRRAGQKKERRILTVAKLPYLHSRQLHSHTPSSPALP